MLKSNFNCVRVSGENDTRHTAGHSILKYLMLQPLKVI